MAVYNTFEGRLFFLSLSPRVVLSEANTLVGRLVRSVQSTAVQRSCDAEPLGEESIAAETTSRRSLPSALVNGKHSSPVDVIVE